MLIVHSTEAGIDLQDSNGASCVQIRMKRASTNPTFPGSVLRLKLEAKEWDMGNVVLLWENQTGLKFDVEFPVGPEIPGSSCANCARLEEACDSGRPCKRCIAKNIVCTQNIAPEGSTSSISECPAAVFGPFKPTSKPEILPQTLCNTNEELCC